MSVLKFRILYDPQHRKGEGGSGEGVFGLSCGASLGACALCRSMCASALDGGMAGGFNFNFWSLGTPTSTNI